MKTLLSIITLSFLGLAQVFSQTEGMVKYTETVKLDIEIDGVDKAMLEMLPKSQSFSRELAFNSTESIYQDSEGEELEDINMSSDDGSIQIKIMQEDTEDIFYKDLSAKMKTHQTGIMGKAFIIEDKLDQHKWKITNEKIKYLDYECQKAVIEDEDNFVIAWFTTQIPVQAGPASYHGLPGLILMVSVNDGESEIKATEVDLRDLEKAELSKPKKGKKVSQEEYDHIQEEKMKEMEEQYGQTRRIRH